MDERTWGWWRRLHHSWDSGVVETDDVMVGTGMKVMALRQTVPTGCVVEEKKIEKDALWNDTH